MPRFSDVPAPNSLTVEQAIHFGKRSITGPAKAVVVVGTLLGPLLAIWLLSWWMLLFIPGSIIISYLFTMWMTPRWRAWAYAGVTDIHQLQRCAELERLLPPQSHDEGFGFAGLRQQFIIEQQQRRFAQPATFIDNPDFPEKTAVSRDAVLGFTAAQENELNFDIKGITVHGHGLVTWSEIYDAHVGTKSRRWVNGDTGESGGEGKEDVFVIHCSAGSLEIPLSQLNASATDLEMLIYVYRGRYEQSIEKPARLKS